MFHLGAAKVQQSEGRKNRRRWLGQTTAFVSLAALVVSGSPAVVYAVDGPTVTRDAGRITMCGDDYCATVETADGVFLSSLTVGSHELLEESKGLRTSITTADGEATSMDPLDPAIVEEHDGAVSVRFQTALVEETWTFGVAADALTLDIERTFTQWTALVQQGSPLISLASEAVDNIRWPGDGGNFPVGGEKVESFQPNWLAAGENAAPGLRTAKRQAGYVLLDEESESALSVDAVTAYDGVTNGRATEVWRSSDTTESLDLALVMSSGGLGYAGPNPLGYAVQTTKDGSPVFLPVGANAGQVDNVQLTFTPEPYKDYYDLGELPGVNEQQLSKVINNYARWMMQDHDMAASTEQPQLQSEVPPLEMHWIGEMIEVFGSQASIESYKAGLQDIHDHLTEASGRIICCHPGWGATWGFDYGDHIPAYVLAVVQAYRLSGDEAWLEGVRAKTNLSLDYLIENWTDPTTHFVKNVNPELGEPDYDNDYWESSTGVFNGYSTALLYEALGSWAEIEDEVFATPDRADELDGIGQTIKGNFNKDVDDGGFWSTQTNTFLYGSGNQDALYLPVNAVVLKSDLADRDRQKAIVDAILTQNAVGNYDLNPMNVQDLYLPDTVARTAGKGGENGGWYGLPEGDFYAGLALADDPSVMQTAIASFLTRYQVDGFFGASTYDRDNPVVSTAAAGWFPLTALPARGLYYYGYGFQPDLDRLVLAPHISRSMEGSRVDYQWRGVGLTVGYTDVHSYEIAFDQASPTPVTVKWGHQEPGQDVSVAVAGQDVSGVTVDAEGSASIDIPAGTTGTVNVSCQDCVGAPEAAEPQERAIHGVASDSATARNDHYGQVGMQIAVGPRPVEVTSLGRLKLEGNADVHRVKILDVDSRIVASAVVDMSGEVDDAGFVMSRLSEAVHLEPGIYYVVSVETTGGDSWYEAAESGDAGPGITILGSVVGRDLASQPGELVNGASTFGYREDGEAQHWIQELVAPESRRAASGESIVVDATVYGQADAALPVTISVDGPEGWKVKSKRLTLVPKGNVVSKTIPMTIDVPQTAETGTYNLSVTATTPHGLTSTRQVQVTVANILFDFDDGTTQGWQAGPGVSDLKAVASIANGPGSPYAGSHLLEFYAGDMNGPDPRTISVALPAPLDLTHAKEIYAHVNSYGAWPNTPDSYQATITLHSGDEGISQTVDYDANTWNRMAIDVSQWEFRNAVTGIDVTYVVNMDAEGYGLRFDLDSVGYDMSDSS